MFKKLKNSFAPFVFKNNPPNPQLINQKKKAKSFDLASLHPTTSAVKLLSVLPNNNLEQQRNDKTDHSA